MRRRWREGCGRASSAACLDPDPHSNPHSSAPPDQHLNFQSGRQSKLRWIGDPRRSDADYRLGEHDLGRPCGKPQTLRPADGVGPKQQAWLKAWIDARLENEETVATPGLIAENEKHRDIYQTTMKTAEQRASRAMEASAGDTLTLADLDRNACRQRFGGLRSIHRAPTLEPPQSQGATCRSGPQTGSRAARLLEAYEELIRHWHSSGIIRGKTTVARKPAEFQAALRALAAEPSNDPAVLFTSS